MTASAQSIVTHMNRDHKLALEDYLYVYGNVPIRDEIRHVRLLNIDLELMTIQFNHEDIEFDIEKAIIFDPPLKDWSEAKTRLVKMAHEAADKRHLSYIQVSDMCYPSTLVEYFILLGISLPVICYFFRQVLYWLPFPSVVLEFLDNDNVLRSIIGLVIGIHLVETWVFLKPKLQFYRVPTDFLIEWYLFGVLEGYPPVRRLEKMAAAKLNKKN